MSPKPKNNLSRPAKPTVASFKTSKGSEYTVDGTSTVRNKSYHAEHGAADTGVKPKSSRTVYIGADAQSDVAYAVGQLDRGASVKMEGDELVVRYNYGRADKPRQMEKRFPVGHTPEKGMAPVEFWDDKKSVHVGNEITEIITHSPPAGPTSMAKTPKKPSSVTQAEWDALLSAEKRSVERQAAVRASRAFGAPLGGGGAAADAVLDVAPIEGPRTPVTGFEGPESDPVEWAKRELKDKFSRKKSARSLLREKRLDSAARAATRTSAGAAASAEGRGLAALTSGLSEADAASQFAKTGALAETGAVAGRGLSWLTKAAGVLGWAGLAYTLYENTIGRRNEARTEEATGLLESGLRGMDNAGTIADEAYARMLPGVAGESERAASAGRVTDFNNSIALDGLVRENANTLRQTAQVTPMSIDEYMLRVKAAVAARGG